MNKDLLKTSIDEWHSYYRVARTNLIPRTKIPLPSLDIAHAVIGVRRCGKTYQAIHSSEEIEEEKVLYYNFEDPLFATENEVSNLDTILSVAQEYRTQKIELLILDEIQNVTNWERWLRKIIDQKKYRVIITGSSAKLLSSEIASSLSGRCLEYNVWPLSFSEFKKFAAVEAEDRLSSLSLVRQYFTWGAFPEVVKTKDNDSKKRILQQYLTDILYKDIITRNEIRNTRALEQIVAFYLTNISSLHSYNALHKAFKMTVETAQEYTGALQNAFLVFEMQRFHQNMKVQSRDPKKIYAIDMGFHSVATRSIHDNTSRLLENVVYLELRRRERQVHYYKGAQEVDFVITDNYVPVEAIQVCYDLSSENTRDREVEGLLECMKELKLSHGTVISFDHEEVITIGKSRIDIIPIYRWLQ